MGSAIWLQTTKGKSTLAILQKCKSAKTGNLFCKNTQSLAAKPYLSMKTKSLQKGELHLDQTQNDQFSMLSVQNKNCKLPSNKSIGSGLNFPTHPARAKHILGENSGTKVPKRCSMTYKCSSALPLMNTRHCKALDF